MRRRVRRLRGGRARRQPHPFAHANAHPNLDPGPDSVANARPAGPAGYIDTHNHLTVPALSTPCEFDEATQIALDTMDRVGVTLTLIMPQPSPGGPCDSSALAAIARAHPERFAFVGGGWSLNPMIQQAISSGEVTAETRRRFEASAAEILRDGAVGFGEFAAEHFSFFDWHPYVTAPPDHPLFLLLADIAAENDVPIDLHMEAIAEDMPFASISPYSRALLNQSPNNPAMLHENLTAFERLLDHNRRRASSGLTSAGTTPASGPSTSCAGSSRTIRTCTSRSRSNPP